MKKSLAAVGVFALGSSLALSAAPAHAVQTRICNGFANACVMAPGGSTMTRTGSAASGYEKVTFKDGKGRYMGNLEAASRYDLGKCDWFNNNSQTFTVIKTTRTRITDLNGNYAYAVAAVRKVNGYYDTMMFLTADRNFTKTGQMVPCGGYNSNVVALKSRGYLRYDRVDNSWTRSYADAKARFNRNSHLVAYNTMVAVAFR